MLLKFIFLTALLLPTSAFADQTHALTMHGAPALEDDFTHFNYTDPNAVKGGKLTQSALGTFDTLNHMNIKGKPALGLNLLHDQLMARNWDEPFTLYPLIAESIEVSEDRSQITYYLNKNATFHDGSPITSDDVMTTFELLKTFGKPIRRQVYALVDQVEKIDDHTVKFTFGEGYDRESIMILSIMPVLSQKHWATRNFDATTLDPFITSGPYKIFKVEPGRQITYERVKDYWAKDFPSRKYQYNFDTITFDYYRDSSVAFEAFKSGDIDLWRENDAARWARDYDFPALKDNKIKKSAFDNQRPAITRAMVFNTRRPIFEDIRTRKALSLAFDFKWINRTLFAGAYKRLTSVFENSPLSCKCWEAPSTNTRKNLRQASKLLTESGWTIKDGKRVNASDEALSFEILLQDPKEEKIALNYARNLEKLGVNVKIRPVDSAQFLGRLNDFDFDMVLFRWINSLSPGNEQSIYWGSEAADINGTRNYADIKDPEIDAIIKELVDTTTREGLRQAAHKLDQKLMNGYYFIPLYYAPKDLIAHETALGIPQKSPIYGPVIESWWKASQSQ